MENKCSECSAEIRMMAFKFTDVCSEICRKFKAGEVTEEQYLEVVLRRAAPNGK